MLALFLVPLTALRAQENGEPPAPPVNEFSLTVAPLSLFGVHRRFRAGVIWHHRRWNYLLDFEYGPAFLNRELFGGSGADYRFYGLRPEIRYALSADRVARHRHFVGVEVPLNSYRREVTDRQYTRETGDRIAFDRARRQRDRVALLLKYTIAARLWQHLHLELYAGAGTARRTITYDRVVNARPENREILPPKYWGFGDSTLAGTTWRFDLALGFRVGYRW
ncbi:hypothetical protein CLV84_1926 [Neolewinella xylanilytica]|uniref:DUF3575 domain-containing protein n=1 Tax=Neolewinella xylanilytica TaxID=1514080 RepID=A0A2S6I1I2_9BACT|nr:hypothetical protein [Neolewinella xylanilytica]PPK85037.1 hypothetical protein CLV84_1926 [Neolewinella xylanilytica]